MAQSGWIFRKTWDTNLFVYFSSKITNAILSYLDRRGEDLSPVLERIDFPEEFMRDPAYWVNAEQLESWLQLFVDFFHPLEKADLLEEVGSQIPELKAWGVLDSVLKMMPRPQEIMNQPEKFLSYFISPAPPVANLRREENRVAFDLPISTEQFPLTTSVLKAAFSVLPCYVSQSQAKCEWEDIHFSLTWSKEPTNMLLTTEQLGHRISPELMQSIIDQLEQNQRELEKRNEELVRKNEELEAAHKELQSHINKKLFNEKMKGLSEFAMVVASDLQIPADTLTQEIQRMQDYMVRAQQVITLMNGLEKTSPLLKEILRRVDWEWAKNYFHKSLKESDNALNSIRKLSADLRRGSQESIGTILTDKVSSTTQLLNLDKVEITDDQNKMQDDFLQKEKLSITDTKSKTNSKLNSNSNITHTKEPVQPNFLSMIE